MQKRERGKIVIHGIAEDRFCEEFDVRVDRWRMVERCWGG